MSQGTMFQSFQWHTADDGSFWSALGRRANALREAGFTAVWMPPAYKGSAGVQDVGYGVYDLYDLGEFDQKGTVRTKYGTRAQLLEAVEALRRAGLRVLADLVLNHKMGADETEVIDAVDIEPHDRNHEFGERREARVWSKFTFPGRAGKYSEFQWNQSHFTAFCSDADDPDRPHIIRHADLGFSGEVSDEMGNFDFLMGADINLHSDVVRKELFRWAEWFVETVKPDGFRLDAIKHIPSSFYRDLLAHLRGKFEGMELFSVGEYWSPDVETLLAYHEATERAMHLFDVPLHMRLHQASKEGNAFDLRTIFDDTLVQRAPTIACTFVDNHDSQPGQSLESWVDDWFKPSAYAMILLRKDGYPCVFAGDYDGLDGSDEQGGKLVSHRTILDRMLEARRDYLFGDQRDDFDHPNCIAWTLSGDGEHPGAMVVMISNGDAGTKRIETGRPKMRFRDITGAIENEITTDESGVAEFSCPAGGVSVWCGT